MSTAEGYNPYGEYPGKKHTIGQRVKQVASWGLWNPDDAEATEANKMRTRELMKMQLEAEHAQNRFMQQVSQSADTIMAANPAMTREQAEQMSLKFHYDEIKAVSDKAKAESANAGYNAARDTGRTDNAEQLGRDTTAANIAQERARAAQMANEENRNKGAAPDAKRAGEAGIAAEISKAAAESAKNSASKIETETDIALEGPSNRAMVANNEIKDRDATIRSTRNRQDDYDAIFNNTRNSRMTTATEGAAADASLAQARRNVIGQPGNADKIAAQEINRQSAIQTPAFGTTTTAIGDPIEGQVKPVPERAAPLNKTVLSTIDPVTGNKSTRTVYGDQTPTGGTTTNKYAIDPAVMDQLMKKYIQPTQ